jgi:cyclic pyranopterin phosphate synthase
MADDKFSHLDDEGEVRMVDVGAKQISRREAEAEASVRMSADAYRLLRGDRVGKGDALAAARIAGIQAAKRTAELIPLCHPVPLDAVEVEAEFDDAGSRVLLRARARAHWSTGVEMEALTAAAVAALTLYDMCKSADRAMVVEQVALVRKSGGRSGDFRRPGKAPGA